MKQGKPFVFFKVRPKEQRELISVWTMKKLHLSLLFNMHDPFLLVGFGSLNLYMHEGYEAMFMLKTFTRRTKKVPINVDECRKGTHGSWVPAHPIRPK